MGDRSLPSSDLADAFHKLQVLWWWLEFDWNLRADYMLLSLVQLCINSACEAVDCAGNLLGFPWFLQHAFLERLLSPSLSHRIYWRMFIEFACMQVGSHSGPVNTVDLNTEQIALKDLLVRD